MISCATRTAPSGWDGNSFLNELKTQASRLYRFVQCAKVLLDFECNRQQRRKLRRAHDDQSIGVLMPSQFLLAAQQGNGVNGRGKQMSIAAQRCNLDLRARRGRLKRKGIERAKKPESAGEKEN